jgi:hypothetical protein
MSWRGLIPPRSYSEDGSSISLCNFHSYLPNYTALYTRREFSLIISYFKMTRLYNLRKKINNSV